MYIYMTYWTCWCLRYHGWLVICYVIDGGELLMMPITCPPNF